MQDVKHLLGNPLFALETYLDNAKKRYAKGEDISENLEGMTRTIETMKERLEKIDEEHDALNST